jgi:hypothetical protein
MFGLMRNCTYIDKLHSKAQDDDLLSEDHGLELGLVKALFGKSKESLLLIEIFFQKNLALVPVEVRGSPCCASIKFGDRLARIIDASIQGCTLIGRVSQAQNRKALAHEPIREKNVIPDEAHKKCADRTMDERRNQHFRTQHLLSPHSSTSLLHKQYFGMSTKTPTVAKKQKVKELPPGIDRMTDNDFWRRSHD